MKSYHHPQPNVSHQSIQTKTDKLSSDTIQIIVLTGFRGGTWCEASYIALRTTEKKYEIIYNLVKTRNSLITSRLNLCDPPSDTQPFPFQRSAYSVQARSFREASPYNKSLCFPNQPAATIHNKTSEIQFSNKTHKFESAKQSNIKSMKNLQCAVYDSGHTKPSIWLQAKATIQRPNSADKTITNAIDRSEVSIAFILRWEGERGIYKVDRVNLPHQSIKHHYS